MNNEPLAYRMRPRKVEDVIGHREILGENTPLRRAISNKKITPMLFYGPPGTGKTTISLAIAGSMSVPFFSINATKTNKKEIEGIMAECENLEYAIFHIDEIHAITKNIQDILLDGLEKNRFVFIGSTTENPFHSVRPAIRSRCGQIIQLKFLTPVDIYGGLKKALNDKVNGFGKLKISIAQEHLEEISRSVNGDMRKALNILESLIFASVEIEDEITVSKEDVEFFTKQISAYSDMKGSSYYDDLSYLQKSIRGSNVNASVLALAKLLAAGELLSVCRRLSIIAFEDIGLANVNCATNVKAAIDTALFVGMPEARIPLAKAVIEMCLSEKSNSAYLSIDKALNLVNQGVSVDIPLHLRDTHYGGSAVLGHTGYQYPHDTPLGEFGGWNNQEYMPNNLVNEEFYTPVKAGTEKRLGAIYEKLKDKRNEKK